MEKTRFTETQIVTAPKRQEGSIPSKELCRELGISEETFTTGRASTAVWKVPM